MIQVKGLTKNYTAGTQTVNAAKNINLEFSDTGMYVILGKSGCGKTTLLNLLSGLDACDEGEILVNGKDIAAFSKKEMDEYHNLKIGVIFQQFNLIPELNVYENLRLVLDIRDMDFQSIDARIHKALAYVGMSGYEGRTIGQLSGGEHQRIAVARALIKEPEIIFADEPTGNLDAQTGENLFRLLKQISRNYATIVVTHDSEAAYKYGDYIITMEDGSVKKVIQNYSCKEQKQYSFQVTKNNTETTKYQAADFGAAVCILAELVCECQGTDELKIAEIRQETGKLDIEENYPGEVSETGKTGTKDISMMRRWKLASAFLKKKKYRWLFTILICSITILLMYFCAYIVFYDEDDIIESYLNQYQPQILPVYQIASYEDLFFNRKTKEYSTGREIKNLIYSDFADFAEVVEYITEIELYKENTEDDWKPVDMITMYLVDCDVEYEVYQGKNIEKPDETVITDYLAKEFHLGVGDIVIADNVRFTISGIIKTDYVDYNYKQKLVYGEDSEYLSYYQTYKYNTIYVDKDYFLNSKYKEDSCLELENSDFSRYNKEISYFESSLKYNGVSSKTSAFTLVSGRMPEKSNEVIVSEACGESILLTTGNSVLEDCTYNFKDIYADCYHGYWADSINLYDYFPGDITVVGTFCDEASDADVYIYDEVWKRIKKDYYVNYYAMLALSVKVDSYGELVQTASAKEIKINEPGILHIVDFSNMIDALSWVFYVVLAFVTVLNTMVMFVFVNISVRENAKNIAILRSLGVSEKQSRNIFEIECKILFVFSVLLSVFMALCLLHYVNYQYQSNIRENPFSIIEWNGIILGIVFALEYLINRLGSYFPIYRLNNRKPIQILHS